MNKQNEKKNDPFRIVIGIISIAYIAYMWINNDVLSTYTSLPKEEALPLIITTICVSLFKVIVLSGGLLFIKWIIKKVKDKD